MPEALWTWEELVSAAAAVPDGESAAAIAGFAIDTRALRPGEVFVALSDARDGHDFVTEAFARGAAAAIVAMFRGETVADASYVNTCYSLLAPNYGISVAGVLRVTDKGIVQIEGGVSPKDASAGFREDEAKYAHGWYASITADTWG